MKKILLAVAIASTVAACGSDDDKAVLNSLTLEVIDSYVSGNEFDTSSAEIVSYDQSTDRLYVVNSQDKTIDILQLDENNQPSKSGTINLQSAATDADITIGAANSVVAKQGLIAVAIENDNKQQNGIIALYKSDDLSLINTFTAGALPDMVTMTDDATKIIAANEGEPSGDYTNDPEGSITLVDISAGTSDTSAVAKQINFQDFNQGQSRYSEVSDVRLPRPHGASVAQDLEPEYITITEDNKAVVALQENNALAIIDLATAEIENIHGMGLKSWASVAGGGQGYQLDVTNKDSVFSLNSYPQLAGYYMPDSLASFSVNGESYVISANEGDGREYIYEATQQTCDNNNHAWDGDEFQPGGEDEDATKYTTELDDCISYIDEARGDDLMVDAAHPLMNESVYGTNTIANGDAIGRIKVIVDTIDDENIAADETVKTFGARSFSIWKLNGEQVFDSGHDLSERANTTSHFNTSNDSHENDNRSDDKGIEPEAVEVAKINGSHVAFIGLERHGGIAVYDVSEPAAPVFLDYLNNRDFTADVCTAVDEDGECDNDTYNPQVGDLGPESIEYFTRNGDHLIAVGNEVSGTTTIYKLNINQ
ncbi:choice-of-anchor I family protein [Bermanella sp. R86510]|uniref:choice-of-anchor I family protein n=1 Tax=unclassified Bermanella TaxID=2627862 RepID=UPI0037C87D90